MAEGTCNRTLLKALGISLAVAAVFNLYPLGERVNDRCTNSVQTSRDLISASAELSTGMENGIYDLKGG